MKVVELVKRHIDPKTFWKSSIKEQKQILQSLFTEICKLYGINNVKFEVRINPILYCATGGGCYDPVTKRVYLFKVSLMTFLHEIAHLLGFDEEEAVLWAHKVFYCAFPKLYLKNVQSGKFFHIVPLEALEKFDECLK
ncbi:MAG: hypothetical protein JHC30_03990 [Caldisericum sp.]|jgi:hypothetical protein|nr:hypothetical protein [Caldisericum sp.]